MAVGAHERPKRTRRFPSVWRKTTASKACGRERKAAACRTERDPGSALQQQLCYRAGHALGANEDQGGVQMLHGVQREVVVQSPSRVCQQASEGLKSGASNANSGPDVHQPVANEAKQKTSTTALGRNDCDHACVHARATGIVQARTGAFMPRSGSRNPSSRAASFYPGHSPTCSSRASAGTKGSLGE